MENLPEQFMELMSFGEGGSLSLALSLSCSLFLLLLLTSLHSHSLTHPIHGVKKK